MSRHLTRRVAEAERDESVLVAKLLRWILVQGRGGGQGTGQGRGGGGGRGVLTVMGQNINSKIEPVKKLNCEGKVYFCGSCQVPLDPLEHFSTQ